MVTGGCLTKSYTGADANKMFTLALAASGRLPPVAAKIRESTVAAAAKPAAKRRGRKPAMAKV